MALRKRPPVVSDDEHENSDPQEDTDGESATQPRKRMKTDKQKEIDRAKVAKERTQTEKLKATIKQMQKQMKQLIKTNAQSNAPAEKELGPDGYPFESEDDDDDDDESATTGTLRPSIRKNMTTPLKPAPSARIRRREGEMSQAPGLPSAPLEEAEDSAGLQWLVPAPSGPVQATTPSPVDPSASTDGPQSVSLQSPAVQPPPASPQLREAPFRNGTPPSQGSRPNTGDWVDEVRDLLLLAIARYSVSLFTINAYPDTAKQREFACRAWDDVCASQEKPVPWALSERMITAIGKRKSNARGDISDAIRPLIAEAYKFRTAINKANEQYNASRSARLVDNAMFHYKKFDVDAGTKTGFAENRFLGTAISLAFFSNPKSVGFQYLSRFNPIPDPAIALILTVIHAHIREWSSGQRIQEQFKEKANASFYRGFEKDLTGYGRSNTTAWLNIRKRLFERTFRAAGGVSMTPALTQVSNATMAAATAELADRTGLTDSEDEGDGS